MVLSCHYFLVFLYRTSGSSLPSYFTLGMSNAEYVHDIADGELNGKENELPANVTTLRITNPSGCTTMPSIRDHATITTVILDPSCEKCEKVGEDCMWGMSSLTSIDLGPLRNCTSVGSFFLYRCALHHIDLTPLSNCTKVGGFFLGKCVQLQTVDLSPLASVRTLGIDLLVTCTLLSSVDLTPLSTCTRVGRDALLGCSSLKTVRIVADSAHARNTSMTSPTASSTGRIRRSQSPPSPHFTSRIPPGAP